MKTAIRSLVVIVCLLYAVKFANAQGCLVDYTPEYAIYQSESTDGTNIYTSVQVEGSMVGSPSAACNYNSAIHTPKAYNLLGSTGGWVSGNPGYMSSYISVTNNQAVPGTTAIVYFDAEGEIICSVFGDFWDVSLPRINVKITTTYWGPPPIFSNGNCYYTTLACTNNTTPTCRSATTPGWLIPGASCPSYARGSYLVVNGTCEFAVGFAATSGGPCT